MTAPASRDSAALTELRSMHDYLHTAADWQECEQCGVIRPALEARLDVNLLAQALATLNDYKGRGVTWQAEAYGSGRLTHYGFADEIATEYTRLAALSGPADPTLRQLDVSLVDTPGAEARATAGAVEGADPLRRRTWTAKEHLRMHRPRTLLPDRLARALASSSERWGWSTHDFGWDQLAEFIATEYNTDEADEVRATTPEAPASPPPLDVERLAQAMAAHAAGIGFGHSTAACGLGCAKRVLDRLASAAEEER